MFYFQEYQVVTSLSERFHRMVDEFRGFHDPIYDQKLWSDLASDLLHFETTLTSFSCLNYLYGMISRTQLNAKNIRSAFDYANGQLKLCSEIGDEEGVVSANRVLCDIYLCAKDYDRALYHHNEASHQNDLEEDETSNMLIQLIEENNDRKSASFDLRLPSTIVYFNSALGDEERDVRIVMNALNISRCSAEGFLNSIRQCKDPKHIFDYSNLWECVFSLREKYPETKSIHPVEIYNKLGAPVLVAKILAREYSSKELVNMKSVNILIAGAASNSLDSADRGCWYHFIPFFLCIEDIAVNPYFVGPEVDLDEKPHDNPFLSTLPDRDFRFNMGIGEFSNKMSLELFDLCVLFHPGFTAHWQEWFIEDECNGISKVVQTGVPTYCTSFDVAEMDIDAYILGKFGIDSIEGEHNSLFVQSPASTNSVPFDFAGITWKLRDGNSYTVNMGLILSIEQAIDQYELKHSRDTASYIEMHEKYHQYFRG